MNRTVQQTSAAKGTEKTAAAVSRYGGRRPFAVQTKLSVGAPGDRYEQEADRVAEQVMRMPAGDGVATESTPPHIQRLCSVCKAGSETAGEEEKTTLQRLARDGGATDVSPEVSGRISGMRGGGRPLSPEVRAFFEPRFAHDFSRVRLHTDQRAADTARALNARAYSVGSDIAFGAGQYSPDGSQGKKLLAHELTHAVQQGAAPQHSRARSSREPAAVASGQHNDIVRRQADFSRVPAGLACPTSGPVSRPPGENILYPISSNTLSPTARAQVTNVVHNWRAQGSTGIITVDGYASIDGGQELNWRLSCNRALAVETELISQGVSRALINVLAHGETTQFSSSNLVQNRRAVVSLPATPTIPPALPVCTSPGVSRNLDVQPVFFRSSATDASPTGTHWTTSFNRANVIWGKLGVTFNELSSVTLTDATRKTAGSSMAETNNVRSARTSSGIEVFMVDNQMTWTGGARTFNLASANGQTVTSDSAGTVNTLLAHELGHVLGLGHPGLPPPLDVEANTIMTPTNSHSGAHTTRNPISNFTKIRFPAPSGSTCLHPDP